MKPFRIHMIFLSRLRLTNKQWPDSVPRDLFLSKSNDLMAVISSNEKTNCISVISTFDFIVNRSIRVLWQSNFALNLKITALDFSENPEPTLYYLLSGEVHLVTMSTGSSSKLDCPEGITTFAMMGQELLVFTDNLIGIYSIIPNNIALKRKVPNYLYKYNQKVSCHCMLPFRSEIVCVHIL
jgi:hypothetical protein